jgi:hypothetical protein
LPAGLSTLYVPVLINKSWLLALVHLPENHFELVDGSGSAGQKKFWVRCAHAELL